MRAIEAFYEVIYHANNGQEKTAFTLDGRKDAAHLEKMLEDNHHIASTTRSRSTVNIRYST